MSQLEFQIFGYFYPSASISSQFGKALVMANLKVNSTDGLQGIA